MISMNQELSLSVKFGFWGLGMGGSSIANECAKITTDITNNRHPYTAFLLNTNEVDLKKINNSVTARKYQLKGYEKGAGRNIDLGEKAFLAHKEDITSEVSNYFNDRDFVWVVAGLGGGTGTGSILEAVRVLYGNGFKGKFGLILTLPRNKEGSTVIENALERLQTIAQAMKGLGSIIVVDNEKLYADFISEQPDSSVNDYLDHSNRYIASTLHELNVVTSSYNPIGAYHFDSSEFLNMIKTPGIFSFGKLSIKENILDADNEATYVPDLKRSIENGILSNGYKLESATKVAVSMVSSTYTAKRIYKLSLINRIEDMIDKMAPNAGEKPIATYSDPHRKTIDIYTVFAGLSLPSRVAELVTLASELNKAAEETVIEDHSLNALGSFKRKKATEDDFDLDEALGRKETAASSDPFSTPSKNEKDPFDGLM